MHVQFLEELLADPAGLATTFAHLGTDPRNAAEVYRDPVNVSTTGSPGLDAALATALREYFQDSDLELESLVGRRRPGRRRDPSTPAD